MNGKGYITTGSVKDGSSSYCVADTWEYDPATDTWTRKDDFKGGVRDGALAFSIGGYGYVGTGCNSDATGSESAYKMDFYRFNPNGAEGSQWEAVSGYGGEKRYFGTAFVIDEVAYICCGRNNSTDLVDFWKFDGSNWTSCVTLPIRTPTMTMTMTTPSHGPKPYPSSSVEGDLWLREYVTALP